MVGSYVVVIHAPGQPPQSREFSQPRIVIGREVGDIVLPDPRCSSTHAELLLEGQTVRVRDLGSTNGTWVNGQRITEMPWAPGVALQIGAHAIVLQEVRAAGPAKGRTMAGNVAMPAMPPAGYGAPPQQASPGYGPPPQGNYGAPPAYGPPPVANAQAQAQLGAPYTQGAPPQQRPVAPKKAGSKAPIFIGIGALALVTCVGGMGALVYMGSQSSGGGSSAPSLSEAREASVKFVWFSGQPGPTAKGGTAPARIRVGPNKSGTVSVGVAEEFAGGGGNQWRTATWLAAFNATRTVGGSLADYEFNVHVGGHTDGPSAGMLTTATMIALIRGQALRADTTMTGTINPDGTAGPVGGIVQKMEGAKESGLKRFGFPIGTRTHKDMKTGQQVDLVSVGQSLGLETKEIGDVYEGYEFLTGVALPRVEPLPDAEMEPGAQTQALLGAKVQGWKARVERELANLKQEVRRTGKAVQLAAPLVAQADKAMASAQRNERNGYLAAALQGYAEAAAGIALTTRVTNAVSLIAAGNLNGLLQAAQAAETVKPEVEAYAQQLEVKAVGKTRGGQINTVYAFDHYVQARAAIGIGDDFMQSAVGLQKAIQEGKIKPTNEALEALVRRLMMPGVYYDLARIQLDFVKDTQDLISDEGNAKPLDGAAIDRAVAGYASASSAVYAYFDALIVEEVAKSKNMTKEDAQALIAEREQEYYLGRKANGLAEYTGKSGVTDGVKLMRLAAASGAYLTGGKLVNKWYSLDGSFDKEGNVQLENRRALTGQLELARRNAREAAARAKSSAGFVPTAARLSFQTGNALREGSDEEKLTALTEYWKATFWSELATVGGS